MRITVKVGDLFRKTNSTNWIWQVGGIFTPHGHRPHARLFRANDPADERIFSVSALCDKHLFIPSGRATRALDQNQQRPTDESPMPPSDLVIVRRAS